MNFFTYPLALWLLLFLPLLGLLGLWCAFRTSQALARLGDPATLQRNSVGRRGVIWTRRVCLALGLVLLTLGMAGPRWGRDVALDTITGRDIVVVLDLSRSMLAEPKSRQERAIAALQHLGDTVEKRGGHRLALIVFAAHAEMICPLTNDYDHFRWVLQQLADQKIFPDIYPRSKSEPSGTRIGAALTAAVQLHDPDSEGARDLLLISDGDDPAHEEKEWQQGIAAARALNIPIDVAGVGDPENAWPIPTEIGHLQHNGKLVKSRLEEGPLQEIASRTRGTYIPLRTRPLPLGKLYHEVLANRERQRNNEEGNLYSQKHQYGWFLGPALLLLSLALLIGDGRKRMRNASKNLLQNSPLSLGREEEKSEAKGMFGETLSRKRQAAVKLLALFSLLLISAAPSGQIEEFIRQGNAAFQNGNYQEALEWYEEAEARSTDPGLVAYNKAITFYHLGEFRAAELHFRRCLDDANGTRRAQALYGLGNSLLIQGKDTEVQLLKLAIRSYQLCRQESDVAADLNEQAAHNLELAKLLLVRAMANAAQQQQQQPGGTDPQPSKSHGSDPSPEQSGSGQDDPDQIDPSKASQQQGDGSQKPGTKKVPVRGTPPVIPDTDKLVAIPTEDTAAYLQELADRIAQESQRAHGRKTGPVAGVKDW